MTLNELFTLLNNISAFTNKVVYRAWAEGEAPQLPFICFYEDSSDNFGADNIVYYKRKRVYIELYSKNKDTESEALIEDALDGAFLFYQTDDTYIESEKCYERIYTLEV